MAPISVPYSNTFVGASVDDHGVLHGCKKPHWWYAFVATEKTHVFKGIPGPVMENGAASKRRLWLIRGGCVETDKSACMCVYVRG